MAKKPLKTNTKSQTTMAEDFAERQREMKLRNPHWTWGPLQPEKKPEVEIDGVTYGAGCGEHRKRQNDCWRRHAFARR